MREQVITHKVGNRSGVGSRRASGNQRATRRESGGEAVVARLRSLLGYFPVLLKVVLAVAVGILFFAGYRVAASASFFQVRKVEVQGASRVSVDEIQALVRKEVEKTGVWRADLTGMNTRLSRLPWVRNAVVSRVLPDGIRVRIVERVPRAVVRTASGRFRWVDDDAVLLGEMLPTDQLPAFFLRGLNEEDPEGARQENRKRVAKFLELQRDWDAAGLSERVSEVNLIDSGDIRAQLAGDYSQIEVRLGSGDGKRLKEALKVLDERQSPHSSLISFIDLSREKQLTVGLASGAHASSSTEPVSAPADSNGTELSPLQDSAITAARARVSAEPIRNAESKPKPDRNATMAAARKKAEEAKKAERRRR